MPIKNGDFLLINYTLKVKETGEIVGTTIESVAKEAKLYRGEEHYEPFFVIVGEGWVPKGLDEALTSYEVGKANTIELPPEKAYGIRDPKKVRLVPLRKFRADGLTPVPGLQVNVDGKTAQVRAVGAGRVQVDYNHPFAGRTLIYDLTVERQVETDEDKMRKLIHREISSVDQQKFGIKIEDGRLEVEVPEEAFFLEGLQVVKRTLTADIEKFLPKYATVIFVETFKKPIETKPTTETKPTPEVTPSTS
ncbi:MAG TPA: FKBP-type peptidyl-prolyl cis-trans isomerase [Candidatus Bathyarchaeia archaeon]|nr:FKBP-type peptidyl-prolyl cis-trans isomerase [Candidatus Bathyarchaeia archaeon]